MASTVAGKCFDIADMKPGERVLTIQSIVGALWPQDRATTNLIFRQFGLSEPVGLAEPDARGFNDSGEEY